MTIYETPNYVIQGVQALDELIATHIYGDPEPYNTLATVNTGFQHDHVLTEAPFSFRAFNWSDCKHEEQEPEGGYGVPWDYCRDDTCEACKPQFHFFETGLKLWWYKHANRIPEANRKVGVSEWHHTYNKAAEWILSQPRKEPW